MKEYLDAGQDVAMLNLGDVSVYATFGYLQEILEAEGYKTVRIPGVPSFCAAAARLGQPLTGGMEAPLTIAPGRHAAEVLAAPGTKVLMKSGRQLPETLAALAEAGLWAAVRWSATAACRTRRSGPTCLPAMPAVRRAILQRS